MSSKVNDFPEKKSDKWSNIFIIYIYIYPTILFKLYAPIHTLSSTAHENFIIIFIPTEKNFKGVSDDVTWTLCVTLERTQTLESDRIAFSFSDRRGFSIWESI